MARILLIDDDDDVRTLMRLTLVRLGHDIIEARDGVEGLKIFEPAETDLVITDILMPEKEGIEVMIELKARNPAVKVIAVSGGGRIAATNYLQMAKIVGAAKVLAKPFDSKELAAAINEVLSPSGPAVS